MQPKVFHGNVATLNRTISDVTLKNRFPECFRLFIHPPVVEMIETSFVGFPAKEKTKSLKSERLLTSRALALVAR